MPVFLTQVTGTPVDPVAATAGVRTLGTGAQQACAGNDSRLSDARTPTVHASSHASGGSDPVTPAAIGAYAKMTATGVKTSAYTVQNGEIVTCDDSAGSFTITLPAATNGVVVGARKFVNSTNTVTIQRAGTDTIGGAGVTSLTLRTLDQVIVLHAVGGLWVPLWDFLGLPALDNRFQPIDADLTTIAGLTATTDNMIQSVGSAWASRTPAQVKAALAITESDVTNLVTDLAAKQPLDSDLTTIAGLTATTDNFLQAKASAWASRTPTQVAADLVTPLSSSFQPLDSDLTTIAGLTPTTDNFMVAASSAWASRTPAQAKTALAIAVADVSGAAPLASPTFTGTLTAATLTVTGPVTFGDIVIKTPQTQSVTTTLAIDASTGDNHQITATGNPAMSVPTNGTNGQMLMVEVWASGGARTVTFNGSIVLSTGLTSTLVIASGKVGFIGLRYSTLTGSGLWTLISATQSL
jgi:hypothetical protein